MTVEETVEATAEADLATEEETVVATAEETVMVTAEADLATVEETVAETVAATEIIAVQTKEIHARNQSETRKLVAAVAIILAKKAPVILEIENPTTRSRKAMNEVSN